ncbi:ATP-binding protein [Treponema endosymbiont of Eucomonympha sp.]|uniref:ATP-binding protein n=1 Tax=Treponema endosymbiont of Eucomonympha sp. TaxID=1580831 RepID=UPI000750BF28|nr:ATP-binding protein [Treponema endosymbiont of Eucomonympha sp.]
MEINIKKAADYFFRDSSLESVYFEAVANSLDAHATRIWIKLDIADFQNVSTFNLKISDNGDGFTDKNFQKFCSLLETEEKTHKGLGRLVYMQYFDKVEIESIFDKNSRYFIFNRNFKGESDTAKVDKENITTLRFSGYNLHNIKQYSYVIPDQIRESLIKYFFPRFYNYKFDKKELEIAIELTTQNPKAEYNFVNNSIFLNVKSIPDLLVEDCGENSIDFFAEFKMHYSVKQNFERETLITAICVDDRTISQEIIDKTCLPADYEMIFLLRSDYFDGKANINRETLEIDDDSKSKIKQLFLTR